MIIRCLEITFDRIEIEAFSKGSIIVDYYVFFNDFEEPVSTTDLKIVLNQELQGFSLNGTVDGVAELGRFRVDPEFTDFIGMCISKSLPNFFSVRTLMFTET